MATYDPVLERKMFKAKEKPSKGNGIADLGEEDSVDTGDYEARRQMAMQMLAAAREKHDPANYQTLAENERPMVFRPTAVNLPQPQQPVPAAQQMAQMQAAGIRPVGMAHGGSVRYGFAGNNGSFVTPNGPAGLEGLPEADTLSPAQKDILAKGAFNTANFNARVLASGQAPEEMLQPSELTDVRLAKKEKAPYNIESNPNVKYNDPDDPTTWSPDFKEAMVDKVYRDRIAERNMVDPNFRSYVKEPKKDDIAHELDLKAADLRRNRGDSPARSEAAARERAMPDKRDYGQEREAAASGIRAIEDQTRRENAMPDKRDYGQEREGIASMARASEDQALRDQAMPDKRDYNQEREANKGIAALNAPVVPGAAAANRNVRTDIVSSNPAAATTSGATDTSATDTSGTATGTGTPKSNEPAKYAPATTLESIKSDRAKERDDNINLALINAGLAMMGGKSSNALVNIGEGGMQGIRQFTEAQRETNRGYREDVKGIREEKRFADEMAQRERMQKESLGATSDLAKATREASAEQSRLEREARLGMFNVTESRLSRADEESFKNSASGRALATKRLELDQMVADGRISQDKADTMLKKSMFDQQLAFEKEKVLMPSDTVRTAATIGGWDPTKGKPPSSSEIIAGLDRMKQSDELDTLEKLVRDPMVEQSIKDLSAARLTSILQQKQARSGNSPVYTEGMTATGPNGQKMVFKNGQWVSQ